MKRLLFGVLVFWATTAFAQTYKQKGVVRMITSSASAPATPVKGVNVVVENNVSGTTGADGAFRVDVTKEFVVNGIAQEDYILALPTRGRTYYYSKNDLDVVVTTKAKREADYKKLYQQIRDKYDAQTDEVNRLRREYQRKLNGLDKADAEYVDMQVKLDSLQALYQEIVGNEENIDEVIKQISDDLAITDFISLSDFDKKVYELKCAGEWKSLSDLLNEIMHGDAASYLQSAIDNKTRAEAARKKAEKLEAAARHDLEARFKHIEDAIEAFMMQHLNDSVSRYYEILTKAAPTNWRYHNQAGRFEDVYQANFALALKYHQKAAEINPCDSLLSISLENIGKIFKAQEEFPKALEYYEKALNIALKIYGENHPETATSYNNIGGVYFSMGEFAKAEEYLTRALKIRQRTLPENHSHIGVSYNNIGMLYKQKKNLDNALEYYNKAADIWKTDPSDENLPNLAKAYSNIGNVMYAQKKFSTSLEFYEKAHSINLKIFSPHHPDLYLSWKNLGGIYGVLGNYEKTIECFKKSIEIRTELFGEEDTMVQKLKKDIKALQQKLNQN